MTNAFVNGFFDECKTLATMSKEAQAAPATDNKWLVPLIASGIGAVGGGLMAGKKKRLQGMLMGALGGAAAGWGGKKIYDQGNQINDLKGDVAARDNTITGLQEDVASRDSTIKQQGDQITGLQGQLGERQQQIDDMGRTIAGHEATIGDLRGNVENLTGQLESLNGNVQNLTGQLSDRDSRISQLEDIAGWKAPARTYLDSLVADRKNLADRNAALSSYLDTVDATGEGVAARDQNLGQFTENLLTARSMLEGRDTHGYGLTSDQLRQTADQLVAAKSTFPEGQRGEGLAKEMKLMADVMDGVADQDALIAQLKEDIEASGGTADAQALADKLAQLQRMVQQVKVQMANQQKEQKAQRAAAQKALADAEKKRKGMTMPTPYARPGR